MLKFRDVFRGVSSFYQSMGAGGQPPVPFIFSLRTALCPMKILCANQEFWQQLTLSGVLLAVITEKQSALFSSRHVSNWGERKVINLLNISFSFKIHYKDFASKKYSQTKKYYTMCLWVFTQCVYEFSVEVEK